MSGGHLVRPAGAVELVAPTTGWAGAATGYRRCMAVGEDDQAVHTGFVISELDPGGSIPVARALVRGELLRRHRDGGDRHRRGVVPRSPRADTEWSRSPCPTGWRNDSELPVRWAEMQAPVPRSAYQDDTFRGAGP